MTHKAVLLALVAVGVLAACTDTRGPNGAQCLKDHDCLSGLCSGFVCAESPPLVDAEVVEPVEHEPQHWSAAELLEHFARQTG